MTMLGTVIRVWNPLVTKKIEYKITWNMTAQQKDDIAQSAINIAWGYVVENGKETLVTQDILNDDGSVKKSKKIAILRSLW